MIHDLSGLWHYILEDHNPGNAHPKLNPDFLPIMRIPQNWFLAGLDRHGVVWFRRNFHLESATQNSAIQNQKYFTLHFSGVDYFSDVFLNNQHLGRHEGYFEPFSFDVTGLLREGENTLAVRVDSPREKVGFDGWHMRKRLIKGVLNHHDCRPGGGWLPEGQSYNTGGIWNRVYLAEHGPITVESFRLHTNLEQDSPLLQAEVSFQNRAGPRESQITLHVSPENFASETTYQQTFSLQLSTGKTTHTITLPVPGVALWNPWDRGFPHLYNVALNVHSSNYTDINYQTSFGFRTIKVDSQFNWTINGLRFFPRASNYIASQWLSETLFPEVAQSENHPFQASKLTGRLSSSHESPTTGWFDRDLTLAREANLNLIRVHAHVLPEEFYEAANRAGILIWQDFPFQWGYQDTPEFHAEAERQIQAMVHLLYNHPSIVAWCIHNESPWDAEWMAQEAGGTFDPTHNRTLDEKLEQVVKSLDATRYVHQNSGVGDGHVYPGWYYGHWKEYANVPGAPFPTEYGIQALPNKDSLLRMFGDLGPDAGYADLVSFKKWQDEHRRQSNPTLTRIGGKLYSISMDKTGLKWLKSLLIRLSKGVDRTAYHRTPSAEVTPPNLHPQRNTWLRWRFHDFQPGETFADERVTLGNSLDEFIASSQEYQAWVIQYATESYRRHKYSPIKGIFHFMFSDPWPAITWAVLDYSRQPKPGYDALQRAMQPVLPSADVVREYQPGPIQFNFSVVNDLIDPLPQATYVWKLTTASGDPLASGQGTMDVPADGVTHPVKINTPHIEAGKYRLDVQLTDASAQPIAQNHYNFLVKG